MSTQTPASGPISMANIEAALSQYIGPPSNTLYTAGSRIALNDPNVRALAVAQTTASGNQGYLNNGTPTASNTKISFSDLRGRYGPDDYGTYEGYLCSGYTQNFYYSNGLYGLYATSTPNSIACGYVPVTPGNSGILTGNGSFTLPSNSGNSINVIVVGAGGGGGGGNSQWANQYIYTFPGRPIMDSEWDEETHTYFTYISGYTPATYAWVPGTGTNTGGGGGGMGALAYSFSIPVTPGQKVYYNAGVGGSGGGSQANGSAGGDSWFSLDNTNKILYATGGGGGTYTTTVYDYLISPYAPTPGWYPNPGSVTAISNPVYGQGGAGGTVTAGSAFPLTNGFYSGGQGGISSIYYGAGGYGAPGWNLNTTIGLPAYTPNTTSIISLPLDSTGQYINTAAGGPGSGSGSPSGQSGNYYGGGGGGGDTGDGYSGGTGASGAVFIWWGY